MIKVCLCVNRMVSGWSQIRSWSTSSTFGHHRGFLANSERGHQVKHIRTGKQLVHFQSDIETVKFGRKIAARIQHSMTLTMRKSQCTFGRIRNKDPELIQSL